MRYFVYCLLFLTMSSYQALADNVGFYSYSEGAAVFVFYPPTSTEGEILAVDFENNTVVELARGYFPNYISSNGQELIAFKQDAYFRILDISTNEIIYSERSEIGRNGTYRWSNDGTQLAVYNRKALNAVEFSINSITKEVTKREFSAKVDVRAFWFVWVEWSEMDGKFLYQFGADDEQKKIYAYNGQKLEQVPDQQRIDLLDDEKYFEFYNEEEVGNFIDYYSSTKKIATFESFISPQVYGLNLMKVKDSLKIIAPEGPILDLESNTFSFPTMRLVPENMSKDLAYKDEAYFIDLAKDNKGYVLQWNRKQNMFQVLDVESAKIVKRYEKFW